MWTCVSEKPWWFHWDEIEWRKMSIEKATTNQRNSKCKVCLAPVISCPFNKEEDAWKLCAHIELLWLCEWAGTFDSNTALDAHTFTHTQLQVQKKHTRVFSPNQRKASQTNLFSCMQYIYIKIIRTIPDIIVLVPLYDYIYIPFHSIPYIHKWKKAAENLIAIVRLAIAYGLMDMSDEKQLPITMFIYATGNWAAAIFSSSCLFNCTFYFGTYNQRNLFAHNKHSYPFMIDVFCALVCCFFHSLYISYIVIVVV